MQKLHCGLIIPPILIAKAIIKAKHNLANRVIEKIHDSKKHQKRKE